MPEFSREDQERAKAWLREQAYPEDGRRGLSSYDIRDILEPFGTPSQSTVSLGIRNLPADLKKTLITSILARLAYEGAEAKRVVDAKAAATQPSRDVTEVVASTEEVKVQPTADEQAQKRQEKFVRDQLWAVIARQVERGLVPEADVTQFNVRGDGVYYLENLKSFDYKDSAAEAIAFLNNDDSLPEGRTAGFYTDGVSREWRQQLWALSKGAPRDQMIGNREANVVPIVPYYDHTWFWGHFEGEVDSWYTLLQRFENWLTNGVPKNPSKEDAAAYEELLRLTAQLHCENIVYEGPEPDVTYATLYRDIDVLWLRIRRGEDAEKASKWALRLAGLGLFLAVPFLVAPSLERIGLASVASLERWLPGAGQFLAELGLLLVSPWSVGALLTMAVIFFLIWMYYTSTLEPWENKSVVRWTAILGGLVVLLVISLVVSVSYFEIVPMWGEIHLGLTSLAH